MILCHCRSISTSEVYVQNITVPDCPVEYRACIHYLEHVQLVLTVSAEERGNLQVMIHMYLV